MTHQCQQTHRGHRGNPRGVGDKTTGIGDNTPGVNTIEDISKVDDAEEGIIGVSDAKETQGVCDDTPEDENESDEVGVEAQHKERTSYQMKLKRKQRKEYNGKNYDNVFNTVDETKEHRIILLQLN